LGLGLVGVVPGVVVPPGFVVLGLVLFGLGALGAVLFGLVVFGFVVFGFVLPGACAPGVFVPGAGVVPGEFGVVCPGCVCGVVVPGPGTVLAGGGGAFGDCAPGCPDCPGVPGAVPPGLDPGDDCAIIQFALRNKTANNPNFLTDRIMMPSKCKNGWPMQLGLSVRRFEGTNYPADAVGTCSSGGRKRIR
jgi:hypothetical protein